MGADISRARFDPQRDFSGVELQQGRVLLDSDFNELVAILDRRLRAGVVDLTGATAVSRATPKAFRLTVKNHELFVTPGRMYVDGLLAEAHGGGQSHLDGVLAEPAGSGAVQVMDVRRRGFKPGRYLAYLEVWQREVTHVEAPDLVEPALGVDTTARWQTVWQVRWQQVKAGATCGTTIQAPIAGGRLSTGTVAVKAQADRCDVPPGTGFRGPDNQLYRVEIRRGGDHPSLVWSRDNASVATAVIGDPPGGPAFNTGSRLRLASLGRDDVLGLHPGDWIEVLDNDLEFRFEPGELRQIATVERDTSSITFTPELPARMITLARNASQAAERNLRVRRWDSAGEVPFQDGRAIELEHGITVTLTLDTPGVYRTGDYWVFAARTDTSIESLENAPPRGIHRHHAPLAIVEFSGQTAKVLTDCRPAPSGKDDDSGCGCACEIYVTPKDHDSTGTAIQDAIAKVAGAGGGDVVLCAGTYQIAKSVTIATPSVRLRGAGDATVLRSTATGPALLITAADTAVERLRISAKGSGSGISLAGLVTNCRISDVTVDADTVAIGLSGWQLGTVIEGSRLTAATGIGLMREEFLSFGLTIAGNLINAGRRGVDLSGTALLAGPTRITDNTIHGSLEVGVDASGPAATDALLGLLKVPGALPAGTLSVCGNVLQATGGDGIRVGPDALVAGNVITGSAKKRAGAGIEVAEPAVAELAGRLILENNRISEFGTGVSAQSTWDSLRIAGNTFGEVDSGIVCIGRSGTATFKDNVVQDIAGAGAGIAAGIMVIGVLSLYAEGNTVRGLSRGGAPLVAGIAAIACEDIRLAGNVVSGAGANEDPLLVGIGVFRPFGDAVLTGNQISAPVRALHVGSIPAGAVVRPAGPGRTFVALGGHVLAAHRHSPSLTLTGNVCAGVSASEPCAVVEVKEAPIVVSGNRFSGGKEASLRLAAERVTVTGNIGAIEPLADAWRPLNIA